MFKIFKSYIYTLFILTLSFTFNVEAANYPNVIDAIDYLTDIEEANIQSVIDDIASTHNLDTVVVITDDTQGKSSMAYADDYYDYNGYGFDNEHSGTLLLINMNIREIWMSTTGKAIDIFTDSRISKITDNVAGYLTKGDYYNGVITYLDCIDAYSSKNNIAFIDSSVLDKILDAIFSPPVLVYPLLLSILITFKSVLFEKSVPKPSGTTYSSKNPLKLTTNTDTFINKETTKSKIQSSSSSSKGRSTTHRSSSGRRHGGGGRRF